MPELTIMTGPEPHWPDLAEKFGTDRFIHLGEGAAPIQVAALPGGMAGGGTSVALRIDLPDGRTVLAETSLKLFAFAADALVKMYGLPDIESLLWIGHLGERQP